MTFSEILTEEITNKGLDDTAIVTDLQNRKDSLVAYVTLFVPFLQLANAYLLKGLPFFSQGKTFNFLKNKLEAEINNSKNTDNVIQEKTPVTCGLEVPLKKGLTLKVRFFNNINVGNFIKVGLVTDISTVAEEFIDQELAAHYLAKIVAKYKD